MGVLKHIKPAGVLQPFLWQYIIVYWWLMMIALGYHLNTLLLCSLEQHSGWWYMYRGPMRIHLVCWSIFCSMFFYTKSVLYSHKYIFFYCGNQLCYFTLYVHATFVTKWTLCYSWIKELYIVWRVDRGCGAFANSSRSS